MAYSNEEELDIEDDLEEFAVNSMRALALNFIRNVTYASPVDTGRFRANWTFSVGTPSEAYSPRRTNVAANLKNQNTTIEKIFLYSDSVLWVSNNLPYALRLNQGSSKQAPAFFVEKSARISGVALRNVVI